MFKTNEINYIDCHMHLQLPEFDGCRDEIVSMAAENGVTHMLCNSTGPLDWETVYNYSLKYDTVVPCFGFHPWSTSSHLEDWQNKLRQYLTMTASGVGEIGLDRWKKPFDADVQQYLLDTQLKLAAELERPVFIHCIKAWGRLVNIIKSQKKLPPFIVIHAYNGSLELTRQLLDIGCVFSFAGNCLSPKKLKARRLIRFIPSDKFYIETDSPELIPPAEYLSRKVLRKNGLPRNEPCNLPAILAGIAEIRGICAEKLKAQIAKNASELLKAMKNNLAETSKHSL
ncbi:Deoxyribonuclease TatD [Limihaloglobus sulfuriphilus]|uniref:Deoxyribonuclease TatD n=1 Tax=Limihaloglobus sulfuriphilus TaxID=1851148 RepID=A0A1Q2MB72_9BACT|nr:TatD family hydrolase [Limihaloglobus sulfuriphilus]AQQ69975.1 Deoxyribonuclease TatD [Limihaloglobus sulfuriphilus]